jgi:azurin
MKMTRFATLALCAALTTALPAAAEAPARLIKITAQESLQWDVKEITAAPGEKLRIAIVAVGAMPKMAMAHNFVLLDLGTDAQAFLTAGATLPDTEYIAPAMKAKVLAKSPFSAGGETQYVSFKAPMKPGKYTYLCTFPGHAMAGMKGVLTVK